MRAAGGVAETIGGVDDHVHMLVSLRSTHRLADVLRDVKQKSSEWFHEATRRSAFAWQEGYAAFTVSRSNVWPRSGLHSQPGVASPKEVPSRRSTARSWSATGLPSTSGISGSSAAPPGRMFLSRSAHPVGALGFASLPTGYCPMRLRRRGSVESHDLLSVKTWTAIWTTARQFRKSSIQLGRAD